MTTTDPNPEITPPPNNDHLMRIVCYDSVFSPNECKTIQNIPKDPALAVGWQQKLLDWSPHTAKISSYRFQMIPYSPANLWLFDKLSAVIQHVNEQYHHFNLSTLAGTQIQSYLANDYHAWHSDLGAGEFSLRKLGLMLFLSPRNHYQGGTLHVKGGICDYLDQRQGSVLVFPTYVLTQIEPLSSGQMDVLYSWAIGPVPLR